MKALAATMLFALISTNVLANSPEIAGVFTNSEGCEIEKEVRNNGTILYVSQNGKREYVGYGNNYEFGDFTYCAEDKTDINHFSGSQGTGILISCSGHTNGHIKTRGRVDISLDENGDPVEVKIDGQIKGFFGWKQDVKINCTDLKKLN